MATVRQLIGHIQGEQGAPGEPDQVIGSTYSYQVTDNGEIPPEGGVWYPAVPEAGQGDYVWTRNLITYASGQEVSIYSVAYQGRDGTFAGDSDIASLKSRVQELEDRTTPIGKGGTDGKTLEDAQKNLGITATNERIDNLDDMTTGINLLRGTKDFANGTIKWLPESNYCIDGFFNAPRSGAPTFKVVKDKEGNAAVTIVEGAEGAQLTCITLEPYARNDKFTLSFEFMFEDISKVTPDTGLAYIGITNSQTFAGYKTVTVKDVMDSESIKAGKWYTAKYIYSATEDSVETRCLRLSIIGNTYGFVRRPVLLKGEVHNPVSSLSPLDISTLNETRAIARVGQGTGTNSNNYVWLGRNISELHADSIGDQEPITWLQGLAKAGTFNNYDLQIGDYLPITLNDDAETKMNYQIAGFDLYSFIASPSNSSHMITLVPTTNYPQYVVMNETATNQGTEEETNPWRASDLYKWCNETFYSWLPKAWQDALLDVSSALPIRYSSSSKLSSDTGYKWGKLGKVWVPSEVEIAGFINKSTINIQTTDKQIPIYTNGRRRSRSSTSYWTRSMGTDSNSFVVIITGDGFIGSLAANNTTVRPLPCFHIG